MFESRGRSPVAQMQNDAAQQRENIGDEDEQSTVDMRENSDPEKSQSDDFLYLHSQLSK